MPEWMASGTQAFLLALAGGFAAHTRRPVQPGRPASTKSHIVEPVARNHPADDPPGKDSRCVLRLGCG